MRRYATNSIWIHMMMAWLHAFVAIVGCLRVGGQARTLSQCASSSHRQASANRARGSDVFPAGAQGLQRRAVVAARLFGTPRAVDQDLAEISGRMLIVGDGDFSFARALAKVSGSPSDLIATSLDSRESLLAKYGRQAGNNVQWLAAQGCRVEHGVDATSLALSLPPDEREFSAVIFQHPILDIHLHEQIQPNLMGSFGLSDRECDAIWALSGDMSTRDGYIIGNRLLLLDFLLSAQPLLTTPDGEVKITIKDVPPYSQWRVADLELYSPLVLKRTETFCNDDYPGYETLQVQKRTPFPSGLSTTYVFGFPDSASRGHASGRRARAPTAPCHQARAPGSDADGHLQGHERASLLCCELCGKVFTSEADQLKHRSSRKHRQLADLEAAWARTLQVRHDFFGIGADSEPEGSAGLQEQTRARARESLLTALMMRENRWH
eukprot:Tamp_05912.p1 GENE.Tamp_05912~~Tamp_05912.p1  ORF type:complete len:437 (+),score=53.14 Tamp_05912:264-1574(+)